MSSSFEGRQIVDSTPSGPRRARLATVESPAIESHNPNSWPKSTMTSEPFEIMQLSSVNEHIGMFWAWAVSTATAIVFAKHIHDDLLCGPRVSKTWCNELPRINDRLSTGHDSRTKNCVNGRRIWWSLNTLSFSNSVRRVSGIVAGTAGFVWMVLSSVWKSEFGGPNTAVKLFACDHPAGFPSSRTLIKYRTIEIREAIEGITVLFLSNDDFFRPRMLVFLRP